MLSPRIGTPHRNIHVGKAKVPSGVTMTQMPPTRRSIPIQQTVRQLSH
jgi:hypothetical protein